MPKTLTLKKYWDKVGKHYNDLWRTKARQMLSGKETGFIKNYLKSSKRVLDVGIGSGRMLEVLTNGLPKAAHIYGIDLSDEMVNFCRVKYKRNKNVRLSVADISKNDFYTKYKFNLITAIRVLKYQRNWKETAKYLCSKVSPGGTLIFTILNKQSINIFAKHEVSIFRSDLREISNLLEDKDMVICKIQGFSRLPDFLYDFLPFANQKWYVKLLDLVESKLDLLLGITFLQRSLFIAVTKK